MPNLEAMGRPSGVVLLACVIVLLVMVAGAVERGEIAGANYASGFPIGFNWSIKLPQSNSTGGSQGGNPGKGGNITTVTTTESGSHQNPTQSQAPGMLVSLPTLPLWALGALAVIGFGGVCFLILRLGSSVHEVDLDSTLKEMEQERRYLERSWSYKLRNAALLRYYLLMRKACLKIGLKDEPAETPQEYVGRISSFFEVDQSQASQFALAVNRSSYGEELSESEAEIASKFMSGFVEVIRKSVSNGQ